MSATALLSEYIIPRRLMYEREAYLSLLRSRRSTGPPFNQYLPNVVDPPADAEVVGDWYLYWALAKRFGLPLSYAGVLMNLDSEPPSTSSCWTFNIAIHAVRWIRFADICSAACSKLTLRRWPSQGI